MKTPAHSQQAQEAYELVNYLQAYFVQRLDALSLTFGENIPFEEVQWLRDGGRHGGGNRYEARDEKIFNRASVNVSQVHYDDEPTKKLSSATAISTIIHPKNPRVPSMHMHISLTEMRDGKMYWRVMADLNPSVVFEEDSALFDTAFKEMLQDLYEDAKEQGDRYFYIPALERTRGVSHFYLEGYNSGDFQADKAFALKFGITAIDTYIKIVTKNLQKYGNFVNESEQLQQLHYHTLYLFQVLTLDRGTTSGLLIHDQNDIGIMGSIPAFVDTQLLQSWIPKMSAPQDKLLASLLEVLGDEKIVAVDTQTKKALAQSVRQHYKDYPEALSMQASGSIVPPTVQNHT